MTSREQIAEWFQRGQKDGKSYMAVVCDTFSWDDYPVYFSSKDSARLFKSYPGEMQKVMEIYDLSSSLADQLDTPRVMMA
jgi:hypothetical protein